MLAQHLLQRVHLLPMVSGWQAAATMIFASVSGVPAAEERELMRARSPSCIG
jgi:hypothetical protein